MTEESIPNVASPCEYCAGLVSGITIATQELFTEKYHMVFDTGGLVACLDVPIVSTCWCHTCRPVTMLDMRFVVCPDCGNKRCPRANSHENACTNSNEPGQPGSAYA